MAYRHLPSPDFHRLDCQHYGLREDEHDHEDGDDSQISDLGESTAFPGSSKIRLPLSTNFFGG
jgi:hypothetical protein